MKKAFEAVAAQVHVAAEDVGQAARVGPQPCYGPLALFEMVAAATLDLREPLLAVLAQEVLEPQADVNGSDRIAGVVASPHPAETRLVGLEVGPDSGVPVRHTRNERYRVDGDPFAMVGRRALRQKGELQHFGEVAQLVGRLERDLERSHDSSNVLAGRLIQVIGHKPTQQVLELELDDN